VRILEDRQHRIGACQRLQLPNQRFQRFLPALLRGKIERRIASIISSTYRLRERMR
jgi:hypothetical protein